MSLGWTGVKIKDIEILYYMDVVLCGHTGIRVSQKHFVGVLFFENKFYDVLHDLNTQLIINLYVPIRISDIRKHPRYFVYYAEFQITKKLKATVHLFVHVYSVLLLNGCIIQFYVYILPCQHWENEKIMNQYTKEEIKYHERISISLFNKRQTHNRVLQR